MAAVQRQAETSKSSAPQAATARRDAPTTDSPSAAAWSARTTVLLSTRTQAAPLTISSPGDAAEHEAETLAHRVVSMPPPASAPHLSRGSPLAARAPAAAPASGDQAQTTAATADAIQAELGGGAPLPKAVQDFMAPRFKADFSGVRIHTDAKAENLATRLGAKAFTYGRHVFFNRGQFQPATKAGKELIAHELAHTIQQSATVQRQVDTTVSQRAQPQVQRGIISEALDWFADKANYIPGFRLITVVIGINPINMSRVERSAANILRALVEFLPGGGLIVEALDRYGIFDKAGSWIESQIASLGIGLGSIKAALDAFVNGLGVADAFRLGAVWERAKRIFTEPIDRLISFAKSLVSAVLDLIKEAILKPLAALAARTPGWDLLKAVLGRDPITGEAVPRTADTLIGGFMKLIGQEEIWENIKRANAIARAWAWFQSAISGLMALVTSIPERFMSTLRSLEIMDLVLPPRALLKVAGAFASFMGDFLSWAGGTVMDLLKIIMEVVAPGVMPYVKKAAGAFDTIIRNPIGFVGTLVQAGKLGFSNFAKNFLTHLRASLVGWLTGAMTGAAVYIPQGFSLREILKFALSVLGLTWTNIRTKLVAATNETVVRALETGFDIVVTLVTEGPAAAWQKILETLSNLRDMVIEQVMTFVKDRIVSAAVTRLLSMLSPAGAFIQAIIAIYNTVMFFVERLRQIAAVAASFIDAIATIAAGNIAPAAARVESTLAGLLTLVISFLARIAGLGRVADAVTNIINRIRAPINNALDRVVAWIVTQARRLGRFVAQAGVPHDPAERLRLASAAAIGAARRLRGRVTAGLLTPILAGIRTRYGLTRIEPFERGGMWWVRAVINPTTEASTQQPTAAAGAVAGANEVTALIGQQIIAGLPGPARLSIPGGRSSIAGYAIRLGSTTEVPSIRRHGGGSGLPDVHIDDAGVLRAGARPGQNRSSEAVKLGMYRQVATDLSLGAIHPEVTAANVTPATNSTVRNALRAAILASPNYQTLQQFNVLISGGKLTGPGMQGELFEAWVVDKFGSSQGITDSKIKYKVNGEIGIMDRFADGKIVEIKSRVRPRGVDPATPDDQIPATRFSLGSTDTAQFARYSALIAGQGQIITKSGPNFVAPTAFTGARYYFNFRGAAHLFRDSMPGGLKANTNFFVGNVDIGR
jgi:hypothetical protein